MKKLRSLTSSTTIAALAGVLLISSVAVASIPEADVSKSKSKSGFTKQQLKTVKKLIAKRKGPTGAAGAAGAQGAQGTPGATGSTGAIGPSTGRLNIFPSSTLTAAAGTNFAPTVSEHFVPPGSSQLGLVMVNGTVSGSSSARTITCEVDEDGITIKTLSGSVTGSGPIALAAQVATNASDDPLFPSVDGNVEIQVRCFSSGSSGTVSLPAQGSSFSLIEVDSLE